MATGNLKLTRRDWARQSVGLFGAAAVGGLSGCMSRSVDAGQPNLVWGRKGLSDGRLMKPRAVAASPDDELFMVDMTGRIQAFTREGEFLRGWRTPAIKQGKPTGLAFAQDGSLLVADTHYFRMLVYSTEGKLDESRTIGGEHGDAPGQFHFVTDVVQDKRNHYFIGQYGQIDHIQEFSPDGEYLQTFGSQGSEPGQFSRPQCLTLAADGKLWVADACNHRVQIFDVSESKARLVDVWGRSGKKAGEIQYPYGLVFDSDGTILISEFGNHRVQRFDPDGNSLELWGASGSNPGQFDSPWALTLDSTRRLHVLDSLNHRVQSYDLG
ncbi:MAG: NHL repeat-containing protein [Aureliella sp.]